MKSSLLREIISVGGDREIILVGGDRGDETTSDNIIRLPRILEGTVCMFYHFTSSLKGSSNRDGNQQKKLHK